MNTTLGTAADSAADVCHGSTARTAREDESPPAGLTFLGSIDSSLHPADVILGDAGPAGLQVLVGRGQLGADDKKLVLNGKQDVAVGGVVQISQQETELRIELVHGAIGFETQMRFRDSLTTHQAGHAAVTRAGVKMTFLHSLYNIIKVYFVCFGGQR